MRKYDLGISVVMILFSAWIFYATKDFPTYYSGAPGSGFWPRILAVLLIVISVVLAVFAQMRRKRETAAEPPVFQFSSVGMKRVYWMLCVMVLTGVSLKFLGFVITSLWFVPAVMIIMEQRRIRCLVVSSIVITGAIFAIFTWILNMSLPKPFFV